MKKQKKADSSKDKQPSTKDKVLSRYTATHTDELWTIDFTNLKAINNSYWVMIIMDLASRQIIAHNVKKGNSCTFTAKEAANLTQEAVLSRQKPKAIHTDQGGQFVAEEFAQYLNAVGITQSLGDRVYVKNPNQVHESTNRTIKLKIREQIRNQALMNQVPRNFAYLDQIEQTSVKRLVNNAISEYNDQHSHSSLFKATPNIAEAVLAKAEIEGVFKEENKNKEEKLVLYAPDSKMGQAVKAKLAALFTKYAEEAIRQGSLTEKKAQEISEQFYASMNTITVALQLETLKRQEEAKEQAERNQAELKQKIDQLEKVIQAQKEQLNTLVQAQRAADEEKRIKEERKIIRSNRTRLPARDAATLPELLTAWQVIDDSQAPSFSKARSKVLLLTLYISGERIANLRLLTANHLRQLSDPGITYITLPCSKYKEPKYREITVSKHVRTYIQRCEKEIHLLVQGKQGDDPVITSQGTTTPLERAYLTNHVNSTLKKTGKILHKKVSSHSFRIGLTTSIIATTGLPEAQVYMGHANIETTNVYNRESFDMNRMRLVASAADKYREQRIKKAYKKRKQEPGEEL